MYTSVGWLTSRTEAKKSVQSPCQRASSSWSGLLCLLTSFANVSRCPSKLLSLGSVPVGQLSANYQPITSQCLCLTSLLLLNQEELTTTTTKNCSETALKIVRKRVVSLEAQTRTDEPKITVNWSLKKKTVLKLLWNCSEIVRKGVVSLGAQTCTNEAKITVPCQLN